MSSLFKCASLLQKLKLKYLETDLKENWLIKQSKNNHITSLFIPWYDKLKAFNKLLQTVPQKRLKPNFALLVQDNTLSLLEYIWW